jgi:flavin-dependent dehydrogenase
LTQSNPERIVPDVPTFVDECDVLVIGGGPAGATAARLLASWGTRVTIVHRPTASHLTLAESLPASTRKLLRFLGRLDAVDAAGFYSNTGNVAEWAGQSRVTTSPDAGFHVPRADFDRVLLDGARAAGARVVDAMVQGVERDDPVCVKAFAIDGRTIECRARYVLDCSGRAGVIARRGLRRTTVRYRTLAIVAEWQCDNWPEQERTSTTIESYADGWAWSVPLSATRRQCTVMIEKGSGVFLRNSKKEPRPLFTVYENELAKTRALAARLANASRISDPWTCDASLYDCVSAADGRTLLVGDAASFIEPLSSAGVKKALLSAWRAAVVTNTCLTNAAMAGPAADLYVRREREVYADCLRRSSAFFAEASAAYGSPFWSARADSRLADGDVAGAVDPDDASDETIGRDATVRAAFERLRAEDRVRLRPSDTLQFASVPAIDGRQVVMREAILVPGVGAPLHYAAGVDLARLVRIATRCDDVPGIIEAYQQHVGPVPLAGLLTGLSLLVARHALVAEDSTS